MQHREIIAKLEANRDVFEALFRAVSAEQVGWTPSAGGWSMLEVVNHLADEEVDDFRQRLEFALEDPAAAERQWKRIAPLVWAEEKGYREREWETSCERFLAAREDTIRWLDGLRNPNWQAEDGYPFGLQLTAERVLGNWLAHDYLHLRQINRLSWLYLSQVEAPTDLRYAGVW